MLKEFADSSFNGLDLGTRQAYETADDDEPPEAAAMAMPVPRPPFNTNAVSTTRINKQPVERPSDLMPSPVH